MIGVLYCPFCHVMCGMLYYPFCHVMYSLYCPSCHVMCGVLYCPLSCDVWRVVLSVVSRDV